MGTIRLFDEKPYDKEFTAKIVDIVCGKDKTKVVLDRTLFFPESGGQTADRGVIRVDNAGSGNAQLRVYDVQIEGDIIYHYLDGDMSALKEEASVTGTLDFDYRFSNMQQHSGEHIFSGLCNTYFGCNNVGFHLSDNEVTFDFDKKLTEEEIYDIEDKVNKVIYENRKIIAFYPTEEELERLDYRSKKEIEDRVRLVEIEGVDLCACCAPHVRSTGEIGLLKVVDFLNYKGGVRISILCGSRAMAHYKKLYGITRDIKRTLSASRDDLASEVKKLTDNIKEAEYKRLEFEKRYLDLIFSGIKKECEKRSSGERDTDYIGDDNHIITDKAIILKLDDFNNKSLRDMVNKLKVEYPDKLSGTFSKSEKGYFFIIGSEEVDCNKVAALMREKLGAKGGGSSDMIQGTADNIVTANELDLLIHNVI